MADQFKPTFLTPLGAPKQEEEEGWGEYLWGATVNPWKGLANTPSHFLDSFVSIGEDLAGWATGTDQEWFDVWKPFDDDEIGLSGKITEEAGSFAIGMISGSVILSALGKAGKLGTLGKMAMGAKGWLGKAAVDAGVGAVADFTLADTAGGNLSNLLNQFPALKDSAITFLKHDEDDSNLEKRLKNAMEGIPLGMATDTLFEGFKRLLKYKRARIDSLAEGNPEKVSELIARETGADFSEPDMVAKQMKSLVEDEADLAAKSVSEEQILAPENLGSLESVKRVATMLETNDNDGMTRVFSNVVTNEDVERLAKGISAEALQDDKWTLKSVAESVNHISELIGEKPSASLQQMIRSDEAVAKGFAVRLQLYELKLDTQGKRLVATANELLSAVEPDALRIQQFVEDLNDYYDTLPAVLNIRRGAARTITAHRNIIMDGVEYRGINGITSDAVRNAGEEGKKLYKMLQDNLEVEGGRERVLELAKQIKELGADSLGFHKKMKELKTIPKSVKALKVLSEIRMANILSGVATQGVNVTGNLINFVLRDGLDTMIASAMGAVRGGSDRMHLSSALAGIGHSFDGITQMWRDFKGAAPSAGKTFADLKERGGTLYALTHFIETANPVKGLDDVSRRVAEGMRVPQVSAKNFGLDETALSGTLLDLMGKAMRAPSFGIMGAMDTVASDMAFNSALARNLKNHALVKGMHPEVMAQFEKQMRVDVLEFARGGKLPKGANAKLVNKFYTEALESARATTFKSELDPSGTAAHLMRWLNRDQVSSQVIKTFVTPFVKTPVNILDSVWSRTPLLGKLRREYKMIMETGTQVEKDLIRARMLSGAAMYGLGGTLYLSGSLTGAHDKNERESLVAAGIPEYSIKVGNSWYSYNRLDPLGSFLGILADTASAARYLSNGDAEALIGSTIMIGANNILNKTYMQGLTNLSDLIGDPGRYVKSFGAQQLQAMIPLVGLQRSVNMVVSPEQKELRDTMDRVMAATVLRGALTDKLDMFGEPVTTEKTPLALILGIRTATEREGDPVRMELAKYNLFPKDNLKRIMGEEITAEENHGYKQALGELGISEGLQQFITGGMYAQMNDAQRVKSLKNLIGRYRSAAKELLLDKDRNLRNRVIEKKRRAMSLLQSSPQGARMLAESWRDIQSYSVDTDGDE